jgi:protein-disulfide isomerase
MTAGCKAQTTQTALDPATINRRVEIEVRSEFNIPQDYNVTIGARKPSQIPGYDSLPVTLSLAWVRKGERLYRLEGNDEIAVKSQRVVDFLISTDGNTLARLEKFDLAKGPLFSIDVSGRPIRGNPDAKVTVINFDDLECPYCARMHESLFPSTLERYKDKVRFIYKDNPLTDLHPWAMHAAVDANCLAAQSGDVYWKYVDYLHSHGDEITGPDRNPAKSFDTLNRIARQEATLAKLDLSKLDGCLAAQNEAQVRASAADALALRIEGAPAVFVDGERIDGAQPEELVWLAIDRALRAAGIEPPALPAPQPTPPAAGAPSKPAQPAGSGK